MKKFFAIVLALSMVLSLAACGASQPAKEAPAAEPDLYTAGTYSAVAQGFGGPVSVEVTVDAKSITDVKFAGMEETPEYGGMAIRNLPEVVLAAQGTEFDTVSSATYTTGAAKLALGAALDQAKGVQPGTVQDGKYTVEVVGHEGLVTVTTMFVGGKIQSVSIPANNETIGVGTYLSLIHISEPTRQ